VKQILQYVNSSTLWELSVQCMFLGDMEMGRYKVIYTTVTVYTVQWYTLGNKGFSGGFRQHVFRVSKGFLENP
jgi:hypothetical protein